MGSLVQYITSPCPVAAGCGALWASSRLSTPSIKSAFFHGRSSYNLYGLYLYAPVRQIEANSNVLSFVFQISVRRTDRTGYLKSVRNFSDAYGAIKFALCELDRSSPAGDVPPRRVLESPLHFAAHRDESVIVGYYTSGEVHLRPRHLSELRKEEMPFGKKRWH